MVSYEFGCATCKHRKRGVKIFPCSRCEYGDEHGTKFEEEEEE